MKKKKFEHPRMLSMEMQQSEMNNKLGDEFGRNGIFEFNVTGVNEYIDENEADLDKPVLLFKIAPDRKYYSDYPVEDDFYVRGYNVLDGTHRLAKAKQQGIPTVKAHLVPMETHIKFMTNGFEEYVSYWNDKLKTGQK